MRSFKRLLFFLSVLLSPATWVSAQDAVDLADDALVSRVRTELDGLVVASEKARAQLKGVEEIGARLKEARAAATAPLPTDPGALNGLEDLDESSLVNEVARREEYLSAYRKRKEQLDRIPSLIESRRKSIGPALEAFRINQQRADDLEPFLAELARRVTANRIPATEAMFREKDLAFWSNVVVQQRDESATWIKSLTAETQQTGIQPASEAVDSIWDPETDRRLQHALDVVGIMLQAARHEATERKDLEQTDHAALPTAVVRRDEDWRRALSDYEQALERAEIKRAALAELDADRRALTPPVQESNTEGEGHSELRAARSDTAHSDDMVRYYTQRLELTRKASDVAKELMEELLAMPAVFERVRRQTVALKAALALAADWQREGKIEAFDVPDGVSVSSLATTLRTIAQTEADRRRDVEEVDRRISNNNGLIEAARKELEQEQEKNRQFRNALQEERSYAAVLKEMSTKDEATLIALVEPAGELNAAIRKATETVAETERELDRAERALREVRDAVRSVENPYVRIGFRLAPERLAEIKAELETLKDAQLPEDRSSNPLLSATAKDLVETIGSGATDPAEGDRTLLGHARSVMNALAASQDFATALWQYFVNLDEKIERYTEALDAADEAFASTDQARAALVNEQKRRYACVRELQRRLAQGRIDRDQVPLDLSKALTREAIARVQSDRGDRTRAYAERRKHHQDDRDRLVAISEFGRWAKIRAEFADGKATLITQPVQRMEAAATPAEDLSPVDRQKLQYDAKNLRDADDRGWESMIASVSRVNKRELFDDSLDTLYLTIARIDHQLRDYAQASEAYQSLIELCNKERGQIVDAPGALEKGLPPRILSYQVARHLAVVAASTSARLTIEDAFKKEFGTPLPTLEQTHDGDKDFWANQLFAAEARLWAHRRWTQDVRVLLSRLGLDAEIAQYELQRAKIGSKIRGLESLRKDHRNSIAEVRSDYSKEIYNASIRTLVSLLLIPLLAWMLVHLVNRFARRIEERVVDGMARDRLNYHERMKTLSSVTRKTVSVVVWVIAGLYLLHELGTPVSTILASAGVMGLAFAFGAQTLIRDFFHGFFILLENQYTIGDWIEIGSISGTVERLTLRVTVLRDMEGTLHFIPNGAVTSVSNMTHGWSQVKMEIGVGYGEDVERVSDVILNAATEVCQRSAWKHKVLGKPVVPGLESFGDSSINIRLVVKTQPGAQWGLARALRKRIKERFDEEGIEIPFPQRVIHHVHDGDSKSSPENATQDVG